MKCDFCGNDVKNLSEHVDAAGDSFQICDECQSKVFNNECVECGSPVDSMMEIRGMCTQCLQVELTRQAKKREAVLMDMGSDIVTSVDGEEEEKFDNWMLMEGSIKFDPNKMRTSKEYRTLWIMFKLIMAGVKVSDCGLYVKDVEDIVFEHFSDLVGSKCKIVVSNTPESRRQLRGIVIGHKNDCYIVQNN